MNLLDIWIITVFENKRERKRDRKDKSSEF
jgi:hypothetical protein